MTLIDSDAAMDIDRLNLDLGYHRYSIFIGPGALDQAPWKDWVGSNQVAIITNETLAPLYLQVLEASLLQAQIEKPLVIILPDGEAEKSLENANSVWTALLEAGFRRNATLIALGGGVIGDLTGFVAATYQRGMPFIQVPTTLLSQVDSSVGGKTAINHPLGKNMIGAFHQPLAVVADLNTFKTLPKVEFAAGMAEVVKYGLIQDKAFFDWLQQESEHISQEFDQLQQGVAREAPLLSQMIKRCCELKAEVVQEDETEQGNRAILNLGHTFGHAIEAHVHYQGWRHGEAIAVGLRMAMDLSWRMKMVPANLVSDTHVLLDTFGLPVRPPRDMTAEHFLAHMVKDKKMQSNALRLVLVEGLGKAVITDQISESKLHECLNRFCVHGA
jgi:3-dehydroquinate synthase